MEKETRNGSYTGGLLTAVLVILVFWGLKAAAPVAVPLAFALFFLTLAWPLQRWGERHLPVPLAITLTLLALLAASAAFVGALWYAFDTMAGQGTQYLDKLEQLYRRFEAWASARGLPVGEGGQGLTGYWRTLGDELQLALGAVVSFLGYVVVTVALLVLGLVEADEARDKLERRFPAGLRLGETTERIVEQVRTFFWTRTITCGLTGVLSGLYVWILGLDFAFTWGLVSFLLNYIPTLGSVVAVAGIGLFALVQFGGLGKVLLVVAGLTAIQLALGSFVDPKLQGRNLALSPFVVLLAIVFWGWLWGIPGALLAVPLTAAIVVACSEHPSSQWLPKLLTAHEPPEKQRKKND